MCHRVCTVEFLLFSIFFSFDTFSHKTSHHFFVPSDVEEDDDGNDDEEDYGGPKEGDDGLGPVAAKNFFDESRKELGGRLYADTKQDEGEEQQSPGFKSMQWMHRNILTLHRQVEVLRQKKADLANRVQELMQRKGLS